MTRWFFRVSLLFFLAWVTALGPRLLFAAEIVVDELSDFDFGEVPPSAGELSAESAFCVALSDRGNYQISALTSAARGEFLLQGVDGSVSRGIGYRVFVSESGSGLGTELMPGLPLSGLRSGARLPDGSCPRPLPRITVIITAEQLGQAPPGAYRGILGFTVAPE